MGRGRVSGTGERVSVEGRGRRAVRDRWILGGPAPPLPTHRRFATAARLSSTLGSQRSRPRITKSAGRERAAANFFEPVGPVPAGRS